LHEGTVLHLWVVPVNAPGNPQRLAHGDSADIEGQFSPDTHWIAYASNDSGIWQVYVVPFPLQDAGHRYQISTEVGSSPDGVKMVRNYFSSHPTRG